MYQALNVYGWIVWTREERDLRRRGRSSAEGDEEPGVVAPAQRGLLA